MPHELRLQGTRTALYDVLRIIEIIGKTGPAVTVERDPAAPANNVVPIVHSQARAIHKRPPRAFKGIMLISNYDAPLEPRDELLYHFLVSQEAYKHFKRDARRKYVGRKIATTRRGRPTSRYNDFTRAYRRVIRFIEKKHDVRFLRIQGGMWLALSINATKNEKKAAALGWMHGKKIG